MKELVPIGSLQVNGEVTIKKFDIDGNCTYEWSGKNIVKDVVGYVGKQWWKSLLSAWVPNFAAGICKPQQPYFEMFRYAYLVNTDVTVDATKDNVFPTATIVGYCDRGNQTIGSDPTIGILNSTESYQSNNGSVSKVRLKYEWGLSKANGTFNSLLHARLSNSAIMNQNDCRIAETTLTLNNTPWDYTGTFAVNIASNGDRIVYYDFSLADDDLGTKKLVMKRKNMTTGVEWSELNLTEWKSKYGTIIPNIVSVTSVGSRLVFAIASTAGTPAVIYVVEGSNQYIADGSNQYIVDTGKNSGYSTSIDQEYVYIRPNYDVNLYRFRHTTITASTSVTATEWVVTAATFTYVVGNKAYCYNQNAYYDLTGANWTTHSTIAATKHFVTYPDMGQFPVIDNAGNCYVRRQLIQYSTIFASGESGEYAITIAPFLQPRQVETSHVKFPAISKTNVETLQIDYTFTFA